MKVSLLAIAGVAAFAAAAMFIASRTASAGHFTTWVHPGAPYAGVWNYNGNANPYTHSAPYTHVHNGVTYTGDWGTDFYASAGTSGSFRTSATGGGAYGIVRGNGTSCQDPNLWAGRAYKFEMYDSGGSRGIFWLTHVNEWGSPTPYVLPTGTTVSNGSLVGWVAYWGNGQGVGSCYQVYTPQGNHWHVQAWQPSHFSCFYPYVQDRSLSAGAVLGAIGSNATATKQPCWTPPPYP